MFAVSALILCSALLVQSQDSTPTYDMQVRQLVFLRVPPGQTSEKDAGVRLMSDHLAFLRGLWEQRKALLVGSIEKADPWRSLVLLDVASKEEAEELIKDEPFVKAGILSTEIKPWFVARNVPQKAAAFLDIEPYWFGTLNRVKDAPKLSDEELESIQAGHMANIQKMAKEGALVLAGPIMEDQEFRGIFIFRGLPKEDIEKLVAEDPAIAKKRLELTLYRWYTAKGTFPVKGE